MIESPKNFIEQFQNFIEHIAGLMKTFLTKEAADNYYLGKTDKAISAGIADTANTATKATQDANGNVIPDTYATKAELTSGLATKQPVGDYRTKSELDSIYLGIDAKAKSAETADSIDWSNITGNPGFVPALDYDNYIVFSANKFNSAPLYRYTVTKAGFLWAYFIGGDDPDIYINGKLLPGRNAMFGYSYVSFPVQEGFVLGCEDQFQGFIVYGKEESK